MTLKSSASFFQTYFDYVGESEAPKSYHRWCAISVVGTLLGRQFSFPFGHVDLYPSQYILLMGGAGVRKSSAIGIAHKLAAKAGFKKFADDRLSKEMFLKSMMDFGTPIIEDDDDLGDLLDMPIDGAAAEKYVVADEFLDFLGMNNLEFITMLTKLWDSKEQYTHPKLHGDDVIVKKPTVNLLAGSTLTNLTLALPPEVVGHGFLTRLILIHAESNGNKITWPQRPCPDKEFELVQHLQIMQDTVTGVAKLTPEAKDLLDQMYKQFVPIDDARFINYSNRRFTHLLKLCLCLAGMRHSTTVEEVDALEANTILHYAECKMPKALGEFGKGKYSSVQTDVLEILSHSNRPLTVEELWRQVSQDLTKQNELIEIVKGLIIAGKVQTGPHGRGLIAKTHIREEWGKGLILPDFMDLEEM